MIGDVSRTGTYRKAIMGNAVVAFRDKTVLDVGAGQSFPLHDCVSNGCVGV